MIEHLTAHWVEYGTALCLIVMVGERLAAITETKKDDELFGLIHKVLSSIGLKFPEVK